ncbi:MAG: hypothetical protein AAFT19_05365 [Pseudomonadota bacterium]
MTRDRDDNGAIAPEENAALDRALNRLALAETALRPPMPDDLAERVMADARRVPTVAQIGELEAPAPIRAMALRRERPVSGKSAIPTSGILTWVSGAALVASLLLGIALGISGSLPTGGPGALVAELDLAEDVDLATAETFFFEPDAPF